MATSPAERQQILAQINTLAVRDLVALWRAAQQLSSEDFARYITDGFPGVADQYAAIAGDMAANWYDDSAPDSPYQATPEGMPNTGALTDSASWALGATGDAALVRLAGTLQRAVFSAARETILVNTEREPRAKWARHASANACAFCRLMATRGAVYNSRAAAETVVGRGQRMSDSERRLRAGGRDRGERARFIAGGTKTRGTQALGDKYHDHCHCVAIEVRPGGKPYEPPEYVDRWEQQYIRASRESATKGPYGAIDVNNVLRLMREYGQTS